MVWLPLDAAVRELTERLGFCCCCGPVDVDCGGGVEDGMLMGWTMPVPVTNVPPMVVGVGRILTERLLVVLLLDWPRLEILLALLLLVPGRNEVRSNGSPFSWPSFLSTLAGVRFTRVGILPALVDVNCTVGVVVLCLCCCC